MRLVSELPVSTATTVLNPALMVAETHPVWEGVKLYQTVLPVAFPNAQNAGVSPVSSVASVISTLSTNGSPALAVAPPTVSFEATSCGRLEKRRGSRGRSRAQD